MSENPFQKSNDLIKKFMDDYKLDQYHIAVFLEQNYGVSVVDSEEYQELLDIESNSKGFKDEPFPLNIIEFE